MSITNPDAVTTRPSLHACYLRILLMRDQGPPAWATMSVTVIYMASASDKPCEYVNQFYVSFGLDDRYLILIVTKCYRDI